MAYPRWFNRVYTEHEAAETKKALEDHAARTQQQIESFTADVTKQLKDVPQRLSTFSTTVEKFLPLANSLNTETHALTHTLLASDRLEEAAQWDRLQTLGQMMKQIEPVFQQTRRSALNK